MKTTKLTKLIIGFLLLFPFRLPISILMIKAFNSIVFLTGEEIPKQVLCTNVIVTKIVYNVVVGAWFVYTIEKLSREKLGRNPNLKEPCFYWTFLVSILLVAFTIIDAVSTYQIFYK